MEIIKQIIKKQIQKYENTMREKNDFGIRKFNLLTSHEKGKLLEDYVYWIFKDNQWKRSFPWLDIQVSRTLSYENGRVIGDGGFDIFVVFCIKKYKQYENLVTRVGIQCKNYDSPNSILDRNTVEEFDQRCRNMWGCASHVKLIVISKKQNIAKDVEKYIDRENFNFVSQDVKFKNMMIVDMTDDFVKIFKFLFNKILDQ
jgi:hypothetical protein